MLRLATSLPKAVPSLSTATPLASALHQTLSFSSAPSSPSSSPPLSKSALRKARLGLPPPVINNLDTFTGLSRLERLERSPLETPKHRGSKVGVVTGTKMAKTVKVDVRASKTYRKYQKSLPVTRRFYAHDEDEECLEGDTVRIMPDRPRSKLKRWYVQEILKRRRVVEYSEGEGGKE